ncbi:MAG: hypothetical protein KGS72_28610 [Cyanobacteria bacterium REEB67]|nr:hypothetical protein [Cyanobacteria bacterium REEB67]
MEELTKKLQQALTEVHVTMQSDDVDTEDAAWVKYLDVRFEIAQYRKAAAAAELPAI